jgi:Bifunctional DNA primase/polymerase, N-terminal
VTTKGEGLEPSPFLLAAGSLTACGLMPIPLRGKRPAIDWKKLQGVRLVDRDWDEADRYLHSWWGREHPYNLGVLTGGEVFLDETRTSRLVVVDVDDPEARELLERTCGWPLTPTVRTSKGWHLWFTHDRPTNRAKVGGVSLDVRGAGGYVVAPPSVHPSGHVYSWNIGISWHEDDRTGMWPPAPLPIELAELLWPARPAVDGDGALAPIHTRKYVEIALEREVAAVSSTTEGARNDQLNRSAFALARFVREGQLPAASYVEHLMVAALRTGLPEPEIRRTLASALNGRQ